MKKIKKSQKKKALALATGFALLALAAGTFAWFTSEDSKKNHFEGQIATGKDIEVVETFEPPTDWEPGSEVNKDVAIANIGQFDTLIRVGLDETLELLKDVNAHSTTGGELEGKTKNDVYVLPGVAAPTGFTDSAFEGAVPTLNVSAGEFAGTYTLKVKEKKETVNGKDTYTYRYIWDKGGVLYHASGIDAIERDASNKIKVKAGTPALTYISLEYDTANKEIKDWTNPVHNPAFTPVGTTNWSALAAAGNDNIEISFNNITTDPTVADKWYFNSADGYFYYTSIVEPGKNTTQLIDSVTLLGTATNDYSKLKYDLTVNGQGISAYKDAVDQWLPAGTNDTLATALKAMVPAK